MDVSKYKTDIDYEYLRSLDTAGVIAYAKDKFNLNTMSKPFEKVANQMLSVCNIVGLKPDNEQLLFILSDVRRCLCESCAGSGKTTMSQMSVLKYKMIDRIAPSEILCIAYNSNAVQDMVDRHRDIVMRVNTALRKTYDAMIRKGKATKPWSEVMINPSLQCTTFHAFCREWVVTFADKLKINPHTFLLTEGQDVELMTVLLTDLIAKRNLNIKFPAQMATELLRVYAFARETLTIDKPSEWLSMISDEDLRYITPAQIAELFRAYTNAKKRRNRMDFADLVDSFYDLLHDREILERIRSNYKVILVDEYQDITPSMLRVIKLIAEGEGDLPRYDDLHLICVGDTDQSIYGYRGTDPYNCVRFREDYGGLNDTRVLSMSTNRRCASAIIDKARSIITQNIERIDKPILGLREGGKIEMIKYYSQEEQMDKIIEVIKSIPHDEWRDTCICYRNNSSFKYIGVKLLENKIAARVLNDKYEVLRDDVSVFVENVVNLFAVPTSKRYQLDVIPILAKMNKNQMSVFSEIVERQDDTPFWELPNAEVSPSLANTLDTLRSCYKLHRACAKLSEYMGTLIGMFCDSYRMSYKISHSGLQERDFISFMTRWYTQDITYTELMTRVRDMESAVYSDIKLSNEISMSTFHGLKGLEFKNVLIVDMAERVFPGSDTDKNRHMSTAQRDMALKEAYRLFYVAVTRAKDRLWLFFPDPAKLRASTAVSKEGRKVDYSMYLEPSRFIKFFDESSLIRRAKEQYMQDAISGLNGDRTSAAPNQFHAGVINDLKNQPVGSFGRNEKFVAGHVIDYTDVRTLGAPEDIPSKISRVVGSSKFTSDIDQRDAKAFEVRTDIPDIPDITSAEATELFGYNSSMFGISRTESKRFGEVLTDPGRGKAGLSMKFEDIEGDAFDGTEDLGSLDELSELDSLDLDSPELNQSPKVEPEVSNTKINDSQNGFAADSKQSSQSTLGTAKSSDDTDLIKSGARDLIGSRMGLAKSASDIKKESQDKLKAELESTVDSNEAKLEESRRKHEMAMMSRRMMMRTIQGKVGTSLNSRSDKEDN